MVFLHANIKLMFAAGFGAFGSGLQSDLSDSSAFLDVGPPFATVNAELVEISGRGQKTAKVDFRLTLAGEQPPRISAQAVGKSSENPVAKFASGFRPAEATTPQSNQELAEHEAVFSALEQQAQQVHTAYKRGLPPWLPPTP